MSRWGIFGGSFDPPHRGHVGMAERATDDIPLDSLYLVPGYQAPLAPHPPLAPARHRLAMAVLVADMRPEWHASPYEIEQRRPVPTIETVEYLRPGNSGSDPYLIIGADQAEQFDQWEQWERLAQRVRIVCFAREDAAPAPPIAGQVRMMPYDSPLSSSQVRRRLGDGATAADALPGAVRDYIREHRLYQ
ncbi:MAG: nicotinate (nicotinamide) nucleotide adenylyltransferase [Candidatus Neomarinimicrobiota bacterium]